MNSEELKIDDKFKDLKPLFDRVFLKREAKFDKPEKVGSIFVPNNVNRRETKICVVLKVGWGNYNTKNQKWFTTVKPGELVYCTRYGKDIVKSNPHDYEGDTYIITRESGLLAYVDLDENGNPCYVRPRMNRIWAKEIKEEKTSHGGIIIPSDEEEVNRKFKVLEVGPGLFEYESLITKPMTIKKGDIVLANRSAGVGFTWTYNGLDEYRIFSEDEVIVRIDEE